MHRAIDGDLLEVVTSKYELSPLCRRSTDNLGTSPARQELHEISILDVAGTLLLQIMPDASPTSMATKTDMT